MVERVLTVPDELLQPIVGYFSPRRVILFGSQARAASGPNSDYDLMIMVDDAPRRNASAGKHATKPAATTTAPWTYCCAVRAFLPRSP